MAEELKLTDDHKEGKRREHIYETSKIHNNNTITTHIYITL